MSVHIPIRQCVACRARSEKAKLLRFVRPAGEQWVVDPHARLPGRGAYLCSAQCLARTAKNKKFRTLSATVVPADAWRR